MLPTMLVFGVLGGEADAAVVGDELDATQLVVGFSGSPEVSPPIGGVLEYGLFVDAGSSVGAPIATLFGSALIAPSGAPQVFDVSRLPGPAFDPAFDAVAAAVTSGPPPGARFAYAVGLAGQGATGWNSGPEVLLSAPAGTCVQSFRLVVPAYSFVMVAPLFYESRPWPMGVTLSAYGTALAPTADSDADGLLDGEEGATFGTDPCAADTDRDGLPDGAEVFAGPFGTDPLDPDTDDDAVLDGADNCPAAFYEETGRSGYNPDQADVDLDGRGDVCDGDSDNDGVGDAHDRCPLASPLGYDADADGCRDTLPGFLQAVSDLALAPGAESNLLHRGEDAVHLLCDVGNVGATEQKLSEIERAVTGPSARRLEPDDASTLAAYVENLAEELAVGFDLCE